MTIVEYIRKMIEVPDMNQKPTSTSEKAVKLRMRNEDHRRIYEDYRKVNEDNAIEAPNTK